MAKRIKVIIHGPLDQDFLKKNLKKIFAQIPEAEVIVSSYPKDFNDIEKITNEFSNIDKKKITVIATKDIINPGFFNINRQINLVNAALKYIDDEDAFVIKVRMDQTINYRKFLRILNRHYDSTVGKIITTNCYTRRDRFYHPSDMFLAGSFSELRRYYPEDFFIESHMDNILLIKELVNNEITDDFSPYWPESRLFVNYLLKKGVFPTYTSSDSLLQLKNHSFLINSWDISLKWRKFGRTLIPVLPYNFKMAPFAGGPIEDATNIHASEVNVTDNKFKEKIYLTISKMYFDSGIYVFNPMFFNYKTIILKLLKKIFDISMKFIPPILHHPIIKVAKKIYYAVK
jgi:hypothetical protein